MVRAQQAVKAPWHLWLVGILSLLWNLMGAADYLMAKMQTAEYVAMMSPEQAGYFNSLPAWITGVWAIGVFGAVLGSALLLARRKWAVELFAASLAAMIVNLLHGFFLAKISLSDIAGPVENAFSAALFVIASGLLYYAYRQRGAGVLR